MTIDKKLLPGILCYFFLQLIFLFILKTFFIVFGLIAVPIGLPFLRKEISVSDGRYIYNLPMWLWIWGNDADGSDGDKRLWWDSVCDGEVFFGIRPIIRKFKKDFPVIHAQHWSARFWWLAVRNPANNLRYIPWLSCKPADCIIQYFGQEKVKDKIGYEGWQLVYAVENKPRAIPLAWIGFYLVVKYPGTNNGLRLRFGYKVEPDDKTSDKNKSIGFAFAFAPYKDLT